MTDLTDVTNGDLITSARANLVKDYIQDGTHKTNTLSLDIGGTELIDSSRNITTNVGTVDGRDVASDGSKLDTIEESADVTDATNVASAGAIMDGDFSSNGLMTRTGAGTYDITTKPSGTIVGTTDTQTLTNKTLTTPTIGDLTNMTHNHTNDANGGTISVDNLSDVSISSAEDGDALVKSGSTWIGQNITNIQGGGQAITIYLDDDVTYDDYGSLLKEPDTVTAEQEVSVTVDSETGFMKGYFYDSEIQRDKWPAGEWLFNIWARVSSSIGTSTVIVGMYKVPAATGTVTMTGTGTSRTATVSGATPFVSGDANADQTLAGYLQTAQGTFQITGYTSSTVVTISTPTEYTNESSVSYTVHKYLFQAETEEINHTEENTILYPIRSIQPAYDLDLTDKAAIRLYGKTTSTSNKTIYVSYNGTERYTNFRVPIYPKHNDLDGLNIGDYVHLTAANHTDLTDSGDSELHYHASDRNRTNHTGTQTASTISDFDTEVANNSAVSLNTAKVTNATHTGDVTGATELTIGANKVNDTHIDWGTGANQVSAVDVPILDSGSKFTAEDVENALQENKTATDLNTAKVTNATHSGDVTGATELTIANDAVTYAKIQNVASDDVLLGRISGADGIIEEVTPAQIRTLISVEENADVTDSTNVNSAGAVMESDYNASTMMLATDDNTPVASTATQIRTFLNVADGSTANTGTVTSVAISGADGIEIDSGSPITTSGTIALGINKSTLLSHINVEDGADVTDTANVTSAGALMDSEVDADIKTLSLPANTTISTFGASLVDDEDASTARSTLNVDEAGTDNSTDVTLNASATTGGMSISTQEISNQAATNAQNGYMTSTLVGNIETNNAKVTNATHTGEVTGSTELTIADNIIEESNMKISNAPVNDYVLTADSGATGGWKWAESSGSGTVTSVAAGNGLDFTTITGSGSVTLGTPSSITDSSTNSVTTTSHTHAIDESSTSQRGIVQLTDSTSSTSTTTAATPNSVKSAYDLANGKIADLSDDSSPSLGGDLDTAQYSILIDATPTSNSTAIGIKTSLTAGESVAFPNVCHMESDGKINKSDANASGKHPAFCMALETKTDGNACKVLLNGVVRYDTWNWTIGGLVYLSETAGGLTQTQPSDTSDIIQIVGVAISDDELYFNPNLVEVTHA